MTSRVAEEPLQGPPRKKSIRPTPSGAVGFPTPPQGPTSADPPHEEEYQEAIPYENNVFMNMNMPFGMNQPQMPQVNGQVTGIDTQVFNFGGQNQVQQQPISQQQVPAVQAAPTPTPAPSSQPEDKPPSSPKKEKPPQNPPKKRTRATPDQLAILEETFLTNTSPNSKLREQLSRRLGMSERSIQIWFQNRRAKVKMMHKRSCQMQEEAIRAQMAMMPQFLYRYSSYPGQQPAPNGMNGRLPLPPRPGGHPMVMPQRPGGLMFDGQRGWLSNGNTPNGSPMLHGQATPAYPSPIFTASASPALAAGTPHASQATPGAASAPVEGQFVFPKSPHSNQAIQLACDALTIGKWRRVAYGASDLHCFADLTEKKMAWLISDNSHQFKMEVLISAISALEFVSCENGAGQLTLDLTTAPSFYMEVRMQTPMWSMCRDFTEGKQASTVLKHILRGNATILKGQVMSILEVESSLIGKATMDGVPFEPSQLPTPSTASHFRRHSGPPLPQLTPDVARDMTMTPPTTHTQPAPETPLEMQARKPPQRSNSVPMLPTYRQMSFDPQSSPAVTPSQAHQTPITPSTDGHHLSTPPVSAAQAAQVFHLTGGIQESPMLSLASPIAGLSLSTPQIPHSVADGITTADTATTQPQAPTVRPPQIQPQPQVPQTTNPPVGQPIGAGAVPTTTNPQGIGVAPSDVFFENDLLSNDLLSLCNPDVPV